MKTISRAYLKYFNTNTANQMVPVGPAYSRGGELRKGFELFSSSYSCSKR